MIYEFHCSSCDACFEHRVPVGTQNTECPECHELAFKRFNPQAVMIQTPASLRHVKSDFQPLATAAHSSSYLEGQKIDQTLQGMHAHWEKRSKVKTIKDRLLAKYPDTNLNEPMTRKDTQELRTLLAAGPPTRNP